LAFSGTIAAGGVARPLLQLGTNDGFRSYPISSVIQSLQVTINNGQVATNLNLYIQAFLRYNNGVMQQDYDLSMSPSMLDQFQNLADWSAAAPIGGSARNPLAGYGENSAQASRGAFPYDTVVNANFAPGAAAVSTITATLVEPLFIAPFTWGQGDDSGFLGVQTMNFNIQTGTAAGLSYMWSHATGAPGINALDANQPVVTFTAPPQLLFTYITPDSREPIPATISYPNFTIIGFPQTIGAIAAGATAPATSVSNIQLENIPNRIFIFARERQADATVATSDVFGYISSINITFNNKSSLLASATAQDLYQISLRNGCCLSWPQWRRQVGSVIALDPSLDLGLRSEDADGSLGARNLIVQAVVTNPGTVQKNYELMVVVVTEGVFTIANQQAVQSVAVLTPADVLGAQQGDIDLAEVQHVDRLSGGSFTGSIGRFAKKASQGLVKALPHIKEGVKVAKDIADVAKVVRGGRRGGALIDRSALLDDSY
jgi:hypothetical protein